MKNTILFILFVMISTLLVSQVPDTVNVTDAQGKKQGYWIKYYPDGNKQYEGYFKDDNPVGEFRRFYEDGKLKSLMFHTSGSDEVRVRFHHPNGFPAAEGVYVNQKKEDKWQFFSQKTENYLICEEFYKNDLRNGPSVKLYKDGTVAERITFVDDLRNGDWTQYYVTGKICIKGNYVLGQLNGGFEVYYANGNPEYLGQYNNDVRDGLWKVYNEEGKLNYEMLYKMGKLDDPDFAERENAFLDMLEKNRGKLSDPEITGTIWNQK